MIDNIKNIIISNQNIIQYIIFYMIFLIAFILIYKLKKEWFNKMYEKRYFIGGILIIICTIFQISGSSIGMWKQFMKNENIKDGILFGKSREIRSDEWAVNTPMAFSQEHNKTGKYNYFSTTIRGDITDTFIIYGQPVLDISIIYRPFHLGYLLLGSSMGLAFFWCARIILLFLIGFEFFMLITKKNKRLSLIGTILITVSPIISWWFAVNGLVEMIIFGELAILLLEKYLKTDNYKKRWCYLLGIAICAGGYLLTFYPAWQVPFIYVFIGIAIWRIIENWKTCRINKKDIFAIISVIILFLISLIYILSKSMDTIKLVMGTVYPGARCETGGGFIKTFAEYPTNMFFGIKDKLLISNVCEKTNFFDLFPLGLIFTSFIFFKYKIKDKLLIILSIIFIYLSYWCIFGLPEIIAKISMLSFSPADRTYATIGFLNILMLIRSLSIIKKPIFKKKTAIIIATIIAIILVIINKKIYSEYLGIIEMIIMFVVLLILNYFVFCYHTKTGRTGLIVGISIIMIISGGIVNPIRIGSDVIYKDELVQNIEKISKENEGLWICEDISFPNINIPIVVGAPTINSTNVYPDLERWKKIDKEEKYKDVYNRYAHIKIKLVKENDIVNDKFELLAQDSFVVKLTLEDIQILEVKYIVTSRNLEDFITQDIKLNKKYEDKNSKIYEIENI